MIVEGDFSSDSAVRIVFDGLIAERHWSDSDGNRVIME